MKIIDLLIKIANGEEVPKNIKIRDYNLNDEVEILEEEKKIPEKLIPTALRGINNLDEKIEVAHIDTISVIDTVNEIIDYLKSKEGE